MKSKGLHLIWTLLILCLLLVSTGWGGIWVYASQQSVPKALALAINGTAPNKGLTALKGSVVIHLGGTSISDANKTLAERKAALEQLRLTVSGGPARAPQKTWTLQQLGLTADTTQAEAALHTLDSGSVMDRAKARWRFPEHLTIAVTWDQATFRKQMQSVWGYMDAWNPVNAKRTITSNDMIIYTPHKDAYHLDSEMMFGRAVQAVEQALGQDWSTGLPPVGIAVVMKVIHPSVTLQKLKDEGVERKIASFTTSFQTSGAGRAYNVGATARTLNDWELAPGEVFDYSKVVAATNEKYGYRAAPVILNGEFVPGVGGGICQVSSTLYNAVLRAGLQLVERRNHSLPVAYLPLGQDATFAEGAINFRFKNTTGKTIVIRTAVENRQLTVKLFGTLPPNVSYKITSRTISTIAPTIKEVARASLQPGSRLLLVSGKSGYVVETFRSKLVNGKVVSTTRISRDTYKAQPSIYATAPDRSSSRGNQNVEKPLLEDGVAD